jgi:hypothetical protein
MDNNRKISTYVMRFFAAFALLMSAVLFSSPINASSRELNQSVPTAGQTQVAWYYYNYWRPYHYYYPYRFYRPWGWHYRYYRW